MTVARRKRAGAEAPCVPTDPWAEAVEHLKGLGGHWPELIEKVGPCRLVPRNDRFGTLVRAIVGQQISAAAASSIDKRLRDLCGEPHEPAALLEAGEETLRKAGLSGVKSRYILNLSEAVHSGHVPLDEIHEWEDRAIIDRLTSIKGVGAWTAEMFLIFALGRPDILSVGDLGIRAGLRDLHGLERLPNPRECHELTARWSPYRTVAMWYIWEKIDVLDKQARKPR